MSSSVGKSKPNIVNGAARRPHAKVVLWIGLFLAAVVVLGGLLALGNIGTTLHDDRNDSGPPSDDYLTAEEIHDCLQDNHRTFAELKECLCRKAYRPRQEQYFRNPYMRDKEWISKWDSYERRYFVSNPSIQNNVAQIDMSEYMIYIGNEVPGRFGSGGSTDEWIVFVGKEDVLIGWIPPPDYRQ